VFVVVLLYFDMYMLSLVFVYPRRHGFCLSGRCSLDYLSSTHLGCLGT